MNTLDILKVARAKIADQRGWTQLALARDSEGNAITDSRPDAVCWSAHGAIRSVAFENGLLTNGTIHKAWTRLRDAAEACLGDSSHTKRPFLTYVPEANDYECGDKLADHARIMEIFDRAINAERDMA